MNAWQLAACLLCASLLAALVAVEIVGMVSLYRGCGSRWTR